MAAAVVMEVAPIGIDAMAGTNHTTTTDRGAGSSTASPWWARVADLRPRVRSHVRLHRHEYRGQVWYVLQNLFNSRHFRLPPNSYLLLELMNGVRTVDDIWQEAKSRLEDEAPSQSQCIHLLSQLHVADAMTCDTSPDISQMLTRFEKRHRRKWHEVLMSPLFWKLPCFDPEKFLEKAAPLARPLFAKWGLLAWISVVGYAASLVVTHWPDLTENIRDRVFTPQSLFLLWILFPILKTIHEFGHAIAVKVYGGEVHRVGLMLLVLTPLPYIDASAASTFRRKRERVIVGLAGMMVELFVASIAFFLWLNVEAGTVKTILYNVILLAGVTTVLFNINPLLRFDGYYVLSDLIEIPNLRSRSTQYLRYLIERYVFGVRLPAFNAAKNERMWLVSYSVLSFLYRMMILTGIIIFIAGKFFFVGILLALWGFSCWIAWPLWKSGRYILTHPRLDAVRVRAAASAAAILLAGIVLVCAIPFPLGTYCEGVVWVPNEGAVRSTADGFVTSVPAASGSTVTKGTTLIVCEDPIVDTGIVALEAELEALQAEYDNVWRHDHAKAKIVDEKISQIKSKLSRQIERRADLTVAAHCDGTLVLPVSQDLVGRFVEQGTLLGHVLDLEQVKVRVVVPEGSIDLVRDTTRAVELRLAERVGATVPAKVVREVPAVSQELPSVALGTSGGGSIAVDPADAKGLTALDRFYQLELECATAGGVVNVGGRAFVRFDHGWEPLAWRWYRSVRRLFLRRFSV